MPYIWDIVSPLSNEMLLPAEAGVNRTEVLAQTFPPRANESRLHALKLNLAAWRFTMRRILAALTLSLTLCAVALPLASHTATIGGTRQRAPAGSPCIFGGPRAGSSALSVDMQCMPP